MGTFEPLGSPRLGGVSYVPARSASSWRHFESRHPARGQDAWCKRLRWMSRRSHSHEGRSSLRHEKRDNASHGPAICHRKNSQRAQSGYDGKSAANGADVTPDELKHLLPVVATVSSYAVLRELLLILLHESASSLKILRRTIFDCVLPCLSSMFASRKL